MRARGFYEKNEGNNYMNRRKKSICLKLSHSLAIHGWLLILSSERESINISSCGQDVSFSCWPYKQLFMRWYLVWLRPKVILPSSKLPKFQGASKQFPWNHCPGSILKWLHWRSQLLITPKRCTPYGNGNLGSISRLKFWRGRPTFSPLWHQDQRTLKTQDPAH